MDGRGVPNAPPQAEELMTSERGSYFVCEGGLPVPQRRTTHTCVYGQYCSAWIYNYFKDMKHEVGMGLEGAEERE